MDSFYSTVAAQFPKKKTIVDKTDKRGLPPLPTMNMRNFEQLLPKQFSLEASRHSFLCINGWLNPDGRLVPCRWRQHSQAANILGFKNECDAEKSGWIKLTQMQWLLQGRFGEINETDEQIATIEKWHLSNQLNKNHYESFKKLKKRL